MKHVKTLVAVVALVLFSSVCLAASLDGSYSFKSRTNEGKVDLQGWNGTMTITGDTINRTYKSPDGKQEKFYTSTMKQNGDIYTMTFTKAYKPEYVGQTHTNKILTKDNTLTFEGTDSKFTEVWTKK